MDRGKTRLKVVVLLMVSAALAGCASLIVGGAPSAGRSSTPVGVAGDTSHDAAITAAVNSRFVNAKLVDALAIRVTTYQGVVTLQGSVGSQAAAARAVDLARSTPHVRRVVSRLTVSR
jgi:hyperosmotically inducible protein